MLACSGLPCAGPLVSIVPFRFEHDTAQRIILIPFEGAYTDDDLQDSYYAFRQFAAGYGPAHVIFDFSKDVAISDEAIKAHKSLAPTASPDHYLIAVAQRPVIYGIARMFELMSDDQPNIVVVNTMESALEIIGAKPPHFSDLEQAA